MCQDSRRTIKCWAGLLLLLAVFFIVFITFDLISGGIGDIYSGIKPVVLGKSATFFTKYFKIDL